jgi:transposase-like protein
MLHSGGRPNLGASIRWNFGIINPYFWRFPMVKKRITHSASFKAKVALAAHRQDKTLSQLAAQFKVHPNAVSRWKLQLLDNIDAVFADGRSKPKQDDSLVDELYQKIGRLEVELDWLKKKSDLFD